LNKAFVNYGSVGLIFVIDFFVVYVTLPSVFQTAQSGMEDLPDILCRNLPGGTKNREEAQEIFILFFGPCIFNNEDKNKPTKCTN